MSSTPQPGAAAQRPAVTLASLAAQRARGEKIAMLTAYDATFGLLADRAGMDCLLIGDSLGMVCQGLASTTPVSLDTMVYHTESVARGLRHGGGSAWLLTDLPFGSYHLSREQALASALRLIQAGAQMIKLEGGGWTAEMVAFLVERGVPVCAHLGLTPQTIHVLGGYRLQGREDAAAQKLLNDAIALEQAGAAMVVLEMVPAALARQVTAALAHCATIGIGAGSGTDGQVLVVHDMLGATTGRLPRFVRNFLADGNHEGGIAGAMAAYVAAVKSSQYPDDSLHAW
ncbi:3-methyl-2-oxobutanoate hydroxymethyltransferase [Kerstersia gyiorum]|uniref:3-methyl-2-oxobutanoate hydroxymethyltransferase n=1 Tax=Kerstersia gyiorum TaxID=206506 RepID=UPI00242DBD38|nr:3-methyl-2-oxobutanoate hydroxymethyltransferase [Kerstersia gyiorum]MCH4272311.1 3-methyl-2-oxobutanoate hydroxymethyltransferase [Kerstersia gyiorum]MCI1230396.1 3-methyl-2-oxobutanoate hydroxymethyltransferase [Kerstersia gyiorum]